MSTFFSIFKLNLWLSRAGEPANYFPGSGSFIFSSGSCSSVFLKRLRPRLQGAKNMRLLQGRTQDFFLGEGGGAKDRGIKYGNIFRAKP